MKRLLSLISTSLLFLSLLLLLFPSPSHAETGSPLGVNVTDHFNEWTKAAEAVGPGGWITIMPQIGDAAKIQKLLDIHPEVNIVIRTHYPDNVPNENQADSWTATLGSLNTQGKKLFIMPWNEPNFERETGGVGNVLDPNNTEAVQMVKDYTDYFMNSLNQAGLLHHNVEMLSPMIGLSAPNAQAFLQALGKDYFNQFYGVSLALYDFQSGCNGDALCQTNPFLNAGSYREVLAQLGLANAKVFALETGIVDQSGTCPPNVPDCPIFETQAMLNLMYKLLPIWANDPNFIMGSILSYNPEIADKSPWIWGSIFEEFLKSLKDENGVPLSGEKILEKFLKWLEEHPMIDCPGGGKAISLEYCQSTQTPTSSCSTKNQGSFRPHAYSICDIQPVPSPVQSYATSFEVFVENTVRVTSIAPNQALTCDNAYWPSHEWEAAIWETYDQTRLPLAGFGESVENTLAESKYIADYLEGTAQYNTENHILTNTWANTGVFRKLSPSWYQDQLKCAMIQKAKDNNKYNYTVRLKWSNEDITVLNQAYKLAESLISSGSVIGKTINMFNIAKTIIEETSAQNIDRFCTFADAVGVPSACKKQLRNFACPPSNPTERFWYNLLSPREAHLWAAVPMFTREDTPGTVTFTVQNPPTNIFEDQSGDGLKVGSNSIQYPLSVPHLARLNDISRTTYNMIMPAGLQNPLLSQNTPSNLPLIASAKTPLSPPPPDNLLANVAEPSTGGGEFLEDDCGLVIENGFVKHYNSHRESCGDIADFSMTVEYAIDGGRYQVACHSGIMDGELLPQAFDGRFEPRNISDNDLRDGGHCGQLNGSGITDLAQSSFKVRVTTSGGTGGCNQAFTKEAEVVKDNDNNWNAVGCGKALPPVPQAISCNQRGPYNPDSEDSQAQKDPKDPDKLDNLRPTPPSQRLVNNNPEPLPDTGADKTKADQDAARCEYNQNHSDYCYRTFRYSTGITSRLQLPYLKQIWQQEAYDKKSGLFNILTPGTQGKFPKTNSKSDVKYEAYPAQTDPSQGSVYFPYLQGIFDAQSCVSQRLLLPNQYAANVPCPDFSK